MYTYFCTFGKREFYEQVNIYKKKNLRWSVRCNLVNKMVMFKSVFVDIFIT